LGILCGGSFQYAELEEILGSDYRNNRRQINLPKINLPKDHTDVNQVCQKPLSRSTRILDFVSRVDYRCVLNSSMVLFFARNLVPGNAACQKCGHKPNWIGARQAHTAPLPVRYGVTSGSLVRLSHELSFHLCMHHRFRQDRLAGRARESEPRYSIFGNRQLTMLSGFRYYRRRVRENTSHVSMDQLLFLIPQTCD